MKPKKSINRFQARELEQKVVPAIKKISHSMHNTSKDAPKKDFHGYEINAGMFTDHHGVKWQIKVQTVCVKKLMLKDNDVNPIIRKNAYMFKLRLFVSVLIDKINRW